MVRRDVPGNVCTYICLMISKNSKSDAQQSCATRIITRKKMIIVYALRMINPVVFTIVLDSSSSESSESSVFSVDSVFWGDSIVS